MSSSSLVDIVMPILLGGGFITSAVTLYRARRTVPVERDSIIVTGAQGAVISLERSLLAETARADREAAEASRLREDLRAMEEKMEQMQGTIYALQATLDDMRLHITELRN